MGRAKAAPVRRDLGGDAVLGRVVDRSLVDRLDLLLARELAAEATETTHAPPAVVEPVVAVAPTRPMRRHGRQKPKRVQFVETPPVVIAQPELRVLFEETNAITLALNKSAVSMHPQEAIQELRRFPIEATVSGAATEDHLTVPLQAPRSVQDVWRACRWPGHDQTAWWAALSRSMQQGLLQVNLHLSPLELVIGLTSRAFGACHPDALPLGNRRRKRSAAEALADVLAVVLDDAAGTMERHASHTVVTAKQVYALVDNVALRERLSVAGTEKPREIPGLVPKLRPYQASAVEWMLEREQATEPGCEWELAWVAIDSGKVVEASPSSRLLYCPATGWLAPDYETARSMTLVELRPIKGGILAESMGLGKSVEVLACILAHPKPIEETAIEEPAAKKKLDFEAEAEETKEESTSSKVGFVDDFNEFGDAESSSDDDSVEIACESRPAPSTPSRRTTSPAVPVTPDDTAASVEERWLDEDVIGSCICGQLIAFSSLRRKQQPIVVCDACREPMHKECAGFATEQDMMNECQRFDYRRMFTNATVDCLSCNKSRCPCCVAADGPRLETAATLIITPPAILSQWQREIHRHTKSTTGGPLKVVVYEGIDRVCKSPASQKAEKMRTLHPSFLAQADIVLMAFEALHSDLGHSDDNRFISMAGDEDEGGNLRKRKRYRVVPSPLQSLRWWRVCLDEAQRVETPTAGSARMAIKLQAENRWCVSGTPVGRGKLEDLYGLLLFLRVQPFNDKTWFNKCFNSAVGNVEARIQHLLRKVFWRSTKSLDMVREQMGVPEQVEKKIALQFSSIEKHFYNRQLEQTLSIAGDVADREKSGKKRKTSQLDELAHHLHNLRAACCHPQVGASGIQNTKKSRSASKSRSSDGGSASLSSRVMTMQQILERFIDDAKLKCELAQRNATMQTNAMAAIERLKVEAKTRGVAIPEDNATLLSRSYKLYEESLSLSEENGRPTLVVGDAILTGSTGFCLPHSVMSSGACTLHWRINTGVPDSLWSKIDFEGPTRKLIQIRLRPLRTVPENLRKETSEEFQWSVLHPKTCVFQVAASAVGGEYVDVTTLSIPLPDETETTDGDGWFASTLFRTNKSKNWRVLIKSFHEDDSLIEQVGSSDSASLFIGLEAEIHEATIASDPLQRLHGLHNATISAEALFKLQPESENDNLSTRLQRMKEEGEQIESLYMEQARRLHRECKKRLNESLCARKEKEEALFELSVKKIADCWDDSWWDDFLVSCILPGSESQQQSICERILQDLDGYIHAAFAPADASGVVKFPEFRDMNGFRRALQMRIQGIRTGLGKERLRRSNTALRSTEDNGMDDFILPKDERFKCPPGMHGKCMSAIHNLSLTPEDAEVYENSHCKVCKADWFQTGPKCRHCTLGEQLEDLSPDKVTLAVLGALHNVVKGPIGTALLEKTGDAARMEDRSKLFFELLDAEKKEKVAAWRMWRNHLDLLNDLDELNQCKRSLRLSYDDEDLTQLAQDELNAVVQPFDINTKYHHYAAKQAMALGDLRRGKDTLRYLKNQNAANESEDAQDKEEITCAVCLSPFDSDRAVLRCGHSFHHSPCLARLKEGSQMISCPMRCKIRTDKNDVLVASSKRNDDGSRSKRRVKGSWGTKVTRLVADILDVRDLGDKGVVFSQWEDMLDIVKQALIENGVNFVRATSRLQIGECSQQLREPDCTVLLLNVKNGAEGLTLLEATHVFMVEPLLNYGLDSQAINRIHRIGQTRKTHVWRYLVEGTIEMKIDKMRMEHQEDQVEDALHESRSATFRAGGIDGGFQSQEELLEMLKI